MPSKGGNCDQINYKSNYPSNKIYKGRNENTVNQTNIIRSVMEFINSNNKTENEFNELAIEIFEYQYANNSPFNLFVKQQGSSPKVAKTWKDIPPLPISAFKRVNLSCCPPAKTGRTFMTSGTTQINMKGKSFHPTLSVYDRSMIKNFKARFLPEIEKIRMGILFPKEDVMPNSSLAHYLALAFKTFGTPNSGYYLNSTGIEFKKLFKDLKISQETKEPVAILGASFSIVHLLDEMKKLGKSFQLPIGSKILDTGGFKGHSREVEQEEFYEQLSSAFGIPRRNCINMYGMTELSTQFYDCGNEICPSVKTGPHWIKSKVVDPLTKREVKSGDVGLLVHCDLAHFNIVSTILTEDMGVERDSGFILLGRAVGENAKGCSLAADEFLNSIKNND